MSNNEESGIQQPNMNTQPSDSWQDVKKTALDLVTAYKRSAFHANKHHDLENIETEIKKVLHDEENGPVGDNDS